MPLIYTPTVWTSESLCPLIGAEPTPRKFRITGLRMRADAVEAGDLFVVPTGGQAGAQMMAAANRGAVAVLRQKGTPAPPEPLHDIVVDDLNDALSILAEAGRDRSECAITGVVGVQNQPEALLIGELLGQQELGFLSDGPPMEGLLNLAPLAKRAIFWIPRIAKNDPALELLDLRGLVVLDPGSVDPGAFEQVLGDMPPGSRVAINEGPRGAELADAVEDAGLSLVEFGREEGCFVHLEDLRTEGGWTSLEISVEGADTANVDLATKTPAVDRCLAAIAGVYVFEGEIERAAESLTVLSVAAASAERLQSQGGFDTVGPGSAQAPQMVQHAAIGTQAAPAREVSDEARAELAKLAFSWLRGDETDPSDELREQLGYASGPTYVAVRESGVRRRDAWGDGVGLDSLLAALAKIRDALGDKAEGLNEVEIDLTYGYMMAHLRDQAARNRVYANVDRGVRGIELSLDGGVDRASPSWMVATNRGFKLVADNFRQMRNVDENSFNARCQVRTFDATQLLLRDDEAGPVGFPLFRGNTLVPQEELSRGLVETMQKELGDFLVKSVHDDGRMVYLYYPSRGTEDLKRNNMIRQFMATVALSRTARFRGDDSIFDVAERNIRYNLRKFYKTSGKLGLIEWNNQVKLGAVALAAISLLEHKKRKQWKRVEQRLAALVEHQWQTDGSYRTFFKPAGRNDIQNFYPGEAQLYRSFLLEENMDDKLLDRFMASFRYYRDWHLEPRNRNPAFIPWHVQAYYKIWKITQDDDLRDFIFLSSDWLLGMQQGLEVKYPDSIGRFHDPKRPQFGPPHASSTGVYLEGLIDSFELAREVGDEQRQNIYRMAICNGLRSCRQVMFKSDADMYYVRNREYLLGGARTQVYNNVVRIDNVQHNQMGILKILNAFEDEDFTCESRL
jgi:hypothetical protein